MGWIDAPSASDDAESGQDDVVEAAWQRLLHKEYMDIGLVGAAYAEPLLRQLHPSSSHQDLHFSRCTGDWSWDVPFIMHLPGGRYLVAGPSRSQIAGEADTAEEAVALVVGGLPPGCGPAVVGGREELDRLDTVSADQIPGDNERRSYASDQIG
ncbi:DUF6193 family natural product biosynthesis protein [Streptomyces sp. NBC_00268]|uniref:DUF6193 family natural product biosynthesis protein n=1 Tax=Streptomyces sp. NBC_00268 TaxID=2975695 RepID=UPI002259ACFF|nr:DUF6193 family natural product biosynthesis protein [Streptomyces sp. NBC_00268]MCX5191140.1 DUF6193 family natural product biosynthesis protein [Streptomyces sp. NBC_00268]